MGLCGCAKMAFLAAYMISLGDAIPLFVMGVVFVGIVPIGLPCLVAVRMIQITWRQALVYSAASIGLGLLLFLGSALRVLLDVNNVAP